MADQTKLDESYAEAIDSLDENDIAKSIALFENYRKAFKKERQWPYVDTADLSLGGLYYLYGNKTLAIQNLNIVINQHEINDWGRRARFYLELVTKNVPPPKSYQALKALKLPARFRYVDIANYPDDTLINFYRAEKSQGYYQGNRQQWLSETKTIQQLNGGSASNDIIDTMYEQAIKQGYSGTKEQYLEWMGPVIEMMQDATANVKSQYPIEIYKNNVDKNSRKQKLIDAINQSTGNNSDLALSRLKLADIYYDELETEKALQLYQSVSNYYLRLNKKERNLAPTLVNIARCYAQLGDAQKSLAALNTFNEVILLRDDSNSHFKNVSLKLDANDINADLALVNRDYAQAFSVLQKNLKIAKSALSLPLTKAKLAELDAKLELVVSAIKSKNLEHAKKQQSALVTYATRNLTIGQTDLGYIYSRLYEISKLANEKSRSDQYKQLAIEVTNIHQAKLDSVLTLLGNVKEEINKSNFLHLSAKELLKLSLALQKIDQPSGAKSAANLASTWYEYNRMHVRNFVRSKQLFYAMDKDVIGYPTLRSDAYIKLYAQNLKKYQSYDTNSQDMLEGAYDHYAKTKSDSNYKATSLAALITSDINQFHYGKPKSRKDAYKKLKYLRKALIPLENNDPMGNSGVLPASVLKHKKVKAANAHLASLLKQDQDIIAKHNLALTYDYLGYDALAIVWGKHVINDLQSIKQQLVNKDTNASEEIKNHELKYRHIYESVANLLIKHNRVVEAQQVIQMLKQYELAETLRSSKDSPLKSLLQFTKFEQSKFSTLNKITTELQQWIAKKAQLDQQIQTKKAQGKNTSSEEAQLKLIVTQYIPENADAMQRYLEQLEDEFRNSPAAVAQNNDSLITEHSELVKSIDFLAKTEPEAKAVGIQYIVTQEFLNILVTRPNQRVKAYQIKYDRNKLYKDINTVSLQIQNPKAERAYYLPALRSLYQLLIKPIVNDLKSSGAKTLMLSLDSKLRLLPFAALVNDQDNYLLEDYTLAIYNEAADQTLRNAGKNKWNVAAMGVSKPINHLPALVTVPQELEGVISASGIDGDAYLNERFSSGTFNNVLKKGNAENYNVLHIASHFELTPGDPERSVLYLGDGSQLSLLDLANQDYQFDQFDLVTYSACQTAAAGGQSPDGSQMESLSAQTQRQGAQAVMATLWKVSDKSTTALMKGYYAKRSKQLNKAEALRATQLSMALGNKNQWQSPHHWAGFIVAGNWR